MALSTVTHNAPETTSVRSASAAHDQPLGLTVHAMPTLDQPGMPAPNTRAGRWKMILVLLVCASPVIASYLTYYVIRPEGRRNFGELIDPQRPLPAMATQTLDGRPGQLTALKNQWLLLTVAGGACDTRCEQNLYFQRQLRESLGREKERLDRVWLVNDEAPVRAALLPALAQATVLRVRPADVADWLAPAPGKRLQDHLYLVDPLGNLMMRFPADMDAAAAAKAKRDLDRLLRAAGSWDKEGR
ncbi:MAG: hypothetical protein JWR60_2901 [Polaromonas sp.]|nr:hypothetical protein [Polaromonas sp.]